MGLLATVPGFLSDAPMLRKKPSSLITRLVYSFFYFVNIIYMPRKKTHRRARSSSRSKSPGNKSPRRHSPDELLEAMGALSLKRGRNSESPPASKRGRRGMRILAVNFLQAPAAMPAAMPAMPEVVVMAAVDDKPVRQEGETALEFRRRKAAFIASKHGGTRKSRR